MVNRSHRLSGRYDKDQIGCMWGLISMFDFRHDRSTHRFLQDGRNGRRHGTGQSAITKNGMLAAAENGLGKLDEGQGTNSCRSSVKKLIEEEMLVEKAGDNEKCNSGKVMRQQSSGKGDKKQKQKKKKGRSKSLDNIYDLDAAGAVGSAGAFHHQSPKPSSNSIDNDITMEELCNNICQRSMDCLKHGDQGEIYLQGSQGTPDFEEKLGEAVKFLVSQKLSDERSLTEDGELQTSKEVMEALQILSSDEELFLKLLRDPNSLVVRYVPDLHDAQLKKDEDFNSFSGSKYSEQKLDNLTRSNEQLGRRRKYHFFRRKSKSNAGEAFRENKDLLTSRKIVILKPGPAITRNLETGSSPVQAPRSQNSEANGELGSDILLSEIKSKLKRAMGKYHRRTYSDGQFPIDRQNVVDDEVVKGRFGMSLPTKNHFSTEKVCVHPSDTKEEEMSKCAEDSRIGEDRTSSDVSNQKVANIYIEAKKHLSDLLNSGHGDVDASSRQSPKTLGKILALPDFNMSPISSPGRNDFMTAKMRFASLGEFQKVDEDMQNKHASNLSPTAGKSDSQPCTSNDGTNSKIEISDMNILVECVDNHLVEETSSLVGLKMTVEDTSMTSKETEATVKEESNCLESLSEPSSSSINKDVSEVEVFEENSDFECSKQSCCPMDQHHVSPPDASSSKSPVSKQVEYAESSDDVQGRPSPVSVLEPLFSDDEISPATTRSSHSAEASLQPMKIQFDGCDSSVARETHHSKTCTDDKKIVLDYVVAVLEVSGLSWEKLCIVSFSSSDQPVDPSLLEEVELLTNHLCTDQKLLFDSINEALMDICMHYSAYSPWVSFVEPNVRPIPTVANICQEIFQEVCWHLQPIPLPHTLEQIVRKDMQKMGRWLELRHDTDCIGAEIGAVILEDLMDDSMVSFIDATSQGDGACVLLNKVDETLNCDYTVESTTRDDHGVC